MNIIAASSMMPVLEKTNSFFINFENFINNMFLNFSACLKYDNSTSNFLACLRVESDDGKKTPKETKIGISKRRESIRKTNLFNEIDIKSFFANLIQVTIILLISQFFIT